MKIERTWLRAFSSVKECKRPLPGCRTLAWKRPIRITKTVAIHHMTSPQAICCATGEVCSHKKMLRNPKEVVNQLPYSLDFTPPSFIRPPLTICMNLLRRYIYLHFTPASASATPTNNRKVELTVPHYIWSLATYWPAIHRPSDWLHGGRLIASWWWCKNCIVFSDRSHSVPTLIISWSIAPQNWATTSFFASRMRLWQTILPLLFPSCAPQRGKGAYKWD